MSVTVQPQRFPFTGPESAGKDARLDRIEHTLDRLLADHQQFRQFHNQLLNAQLLHHETVKRFLKVVLEQTRSSAEQGKQLEIQGLQFRDRSEGIDLRIEKLVSALGEFIRKTDP
jgi:hypothetical protein